jgi:hypothetical protein
MPCLNGLGHACEARLQQAEAEGHELHDQVGALLGWHLQSPRPRRAHHRLPLLGRALGEGRKSGGSPRGERLWVGSARDKRVCVGGVNEGQKGVGGMKEAQKGVCGWGQRGTTGGMANQRGTLQDGTSVGGLRGSSTWWSCGAPRSRASWPDCCRRSRGLSPR